VLAAMAYSVRIKHSAVKEIAALPKRDRRRVVSAIEGLAKTPRPKGVRKMVGSKNCCRLRVGDYRVIYEIGDRVLTVSVVRVRHRSEGYR
jgi:mRNA interferase RelE/StbE